MAAPNASGFSAPYASSSSAVNPQGLKRPRPSRNFLKKKTVDLSSVYEYKAFKFVINNVTQVLELNDDPIFSDEFQPPETKDVKFQLGFFPKAESEEKTGYAEVKLLLTECKPKRLSVQYKIALLNKNGDEKFLKEGRENLDMPNNIWSIPQYHVATSTILNDKYFLIKNNSLTVFCEIRLGFNAVRESQLRVCHDLEMLLQSNKFSDVTIIVKGSPFKAHKAILGARSQVFAAMFELDCIEKKENKTEIEDVDPEIFQQVLNYIYFGQVQIGLTTAADIFEAADKYEVMGLKSLCEEFLADHLTMDVVPQVLTLADMHHSEELKQACIDFLSDNSNEINITTWNTLQLHPDITYKLFCDVSSKKSKKEDPKPSSTSISRFRCFACNGINRIAPQVGANRVGLHLPRANPDQNANRAGPGILFHAYPQAQAFNNHRYAFPPIFDDFIPPPPNPLQNPRLNRMVNYLRNAPGRQNDNAHAAGVARGAAYEANANAYGINAGGNVNQNHVLVAAVVDDNANVNANADVNENAAI